MLEIEGILSEVEIIEGVRGLKDLKIKVGGIDFYKTVWELDEKTRRNYKPTSIIDELKHSEEFPKEEFINKLKGSIYSRLRVEFQEMNTNIFSFLLDRLSKLKTPKKYREIKSIEYLGQETL